MHRHSRNNSYILFTYILPAVRAHSFTEQ